MTKSFIQFIVVSLRLYYSFIILPAQSVSRWTQQVLSASLGFTCLVLISSFFDPPFFISFVLITSYSNHLSYNNFICPFVDLIPHFNPIIFPAIAIRNCFVFARYWTVPASLFLYVFFLVFMKLRTSSFVCYDIFLVDIVVNTSRRSTLPLHRLIHLSQQNTELDPSFTVKLTSSSSNYYSTLYTLLVIAGRSSRLHTCTYIFGAGTSSILLLCLTSGSRSYHT